MRIGTSLRGRSDGYLGSGYRIQLDIFEPSTAVGPYVGFLENRASKQSFDDPKGSHPLFYPS